MAKRKPRKQHRVANKRAPDAGKRKERVDALAAALKNKGVLPERTDIELRKWKQALDAPGEYTPEAEAAIEYAAGWRR